MRILCACRMRVCVAYVDGQCVRASMATSQRSKHTQCAYIGHTRREKNYIPMVCCSAAYPAYNSHPHRNCNSHPQLEFSTVIHITYIPCVCTQHSHHRTLLLLLWLWLWIWLRIYRNACNRPPFVYGVPGLSQQNAHNITMAIYISSYIGE